MHYGDIIKSNLNTKRITVTRAASYIAVTRQTFYNKMRTGKFFISEINILKEKGLL